MKNKNIITVVSYPRSGRKLIITMLQSYFKDIDPETNFQRDHDFGGRLKIEREKNI